MPRIISLASANLLFASASAAVLPYAPIYRRQNETYTNETSWPTFDNVTASSELRWIDCYGPSRQCARLTVPLDYEDPDQGTTDVAFIRYVLSEDAEDMLFNPGGPGDGGVSWGAPGGGGEEFAKAWGYNFVSFDPRGTGLTGPAFGCLPKNDTTPPSPPETIGALGNLTQTWDYNVDTSEACTKANADTNARYIGTSAVVQDLVHFTKIQAASRGKNPKDALINYFGVSYGTVIGQALAATYPDRLRRIVLDGNVHGVSYYQGWVSNSVDGLDHSVWLFTKLCYEAGKEYCQLSEGANSSDEVKQRFDSVVDTLHKQPIDLGDGTFFGADLLFSIATQSFYQPATGPSNNYSTLDTIVSSLYSNDTSFLNDLDGAPTPATEDVTQDALRLITATDIAGRYPWHTYAEWKAASDRLYATAPRFAENYVTTNGLIGLIDIEPPSSQFFPGFENKTQTSAPILFVNTVADPVTPAASAREMSRLFPGSGVLIVNGPGHSHLGTYSKCANMAIAAYWANGTVPSEEKWCETSVDANYYFGGPAPKSLLTRRGNVFSQ